MSWSPPHQHNAPRIKDDTTATGIACSCAEIGIGERTAILKTPAWMSRMRSAVASASYGSRRPAVDPWRQNASTGRGMLGARFGDGDGRMGTWSVGSRSLARMALVPHALQHGSPCLTATLSSSRCPRRRCLVRYRRLIVLGTTGRHRASRWNRRWRASRAPSSASFCCWDPG